MKKNLFLAALAFVALASCTSDEFVGDNTPPTTSNTAGAIQFTSNAPRITRADGGATAAKTLDYKFKVYATKTVTETSGDVTSNVFAREEYSTATNYNATPYDVWYGETAAHETSSNTSGWDYVGTNGNSYGKVDGDDNYKVTLTADQTIKYWDYGAKQYDFVAYSATHTTGTGTTATPKITNYTTSGFTVEATAEDLAGLYVADKVTLQTSVADDVDNNPTKPATSINKIGGIVQFTFRSAATKVRLGIYETINGYDVRNVKFYYTNSTEQSSTSNAYLTGSFNGTSSSTSGTYNVTYNSTTGIAEYDATAAASTYFDFGTFASYAPTPHGTAIGTTSVDPMWATGSSDYQSVLSNTDNVANMILKVDYDLYNTVTQETIHVKGAKAVVPAMYMTWNPNYAYTYLFKISDNTNGTTGTVGTSPEGLYPITFDALTIAATGEEVGTITTVSTPTITTYQKGSVSTEGITYATASTTEPIYITVNLNGSLESLTTGASGNTNLYTVDAGTTEADLILTSKTKTDSDLLSILNQNVTQQGITFISGKTAQFTPTAGTYAVEYKGYYDIKPANGTSLEGYYSRGGSEGSYTYSEASGTADGNTVYYKPVTQYKVIVVAAATTPTSDPEP